MDPTEKSINRRRLIALFTPSWFSGMMAILGGIIVTGGVILAFNFSNSGLKQELLSFESTPTKQPALTLPGQAPSQAKNSLQNTWPLIAFWGMTGLIVYFIVEYFIKELGSAEEFTKSLTYVHAKRNAMIRSAVELILIRIVCAVMWLVFIDLFFKRIIPYSITAAQAAVSHSSLSSSIISGLLSFSIIVISLHINVIFLRLLLRRPRLFSSVDYSDV